jgi:hypothetical protein
LGRRLLPAGPTAGEEICVLCRGIITLDQEEKVLPSPNSSLTGHDQTNPFDFCYSFGIADSRGQELLYYCKA